MKRMAVVCILTCLATPVLADGSSARELAGQAEAAMGAGDFEKALEAYKQAEVTMPTSPELAYNRGVAHYKLGQYDDAREFFSKALSTRDLALEAKCKFNLGNVAYASALEKLSDFQEAIDLLKSAMTRYRDALELDPDDGDAKENIQKAQLLIKDLLDKLKKQQEEQQKNQDQQQQQQSDENQDSSGEKQDQQQQDGEQQEQQNIEGEQGEDQEQQPQDQQGQPDEQEQDSAEQEQQAEPREMTREEAERMLQAVRDRERQRREELAKRRMLRRGGVVKDW